MPPAIVPSVARRATGAMRRAEIAGTGLRARIVGLRLVMATDVARLARRTGGRPTKTEVRVRSNRRAGTLRPVRDR